MYFKVVSPISLIWSARARCFFPVIFGSHVNNKATCVDMGHFCDRLLVFVLMGFLENDGDLLRVLLEGSETVSFLV